MSLKRRRILKAMGAGAMALAMGGLTAEGAAEKAVFELRVYHALEGRLPALLARFRDHTVALFAKHGITNIAYWTPTEEPLKGKTLIYVLRHANRDAAATSWKAFQDDPEWKRVKAESEASGPIVASIDSTYMEMTDFSPKV